MENSLLGFFAGVMLSFMIYLICKEDPKKRYIEKYYQEMYIGELEHELQKEQTKNEIYKIMLECKK